MVDVGGLAVVEERDIGTQKVEGVGVGRDIADARHVNVRAGRQADVEDGRVGDGDGRGRL